MTPSNPERLRQPPNVQSALRELKAAREALAASSSRKETLRAASAACAALRKLRTRLRELGATSASDGCQQTAKVLESQMSDPSMLRSPYVLAQVEQTERAGVAAMRSAVVAQTPVPRRSTGKVYRRSPDSYRCDACRMTPNRCAACRKIRAKHTASRRTAKSGDGLCPHCPFEPGTPVYVGADGHVYSACEKHLDEVATNSRASHERRRKGACEYRKS